MSKAREATAIADTTAYAAKAQHSKMALYHQDGDVKRTRLDSPVFSRIEANQFKSLIGIYDWTCDPEWIKEDIMAAGVL